MDDYNRADRVRCWQGGPSGAGSIQHTRNQVQGPGEVLSQAIGDRSETRLHCGSKVLARHKWPTAQGPTTSRRQDQKQGWRENNIIQVRTHGPRLCWEGAPGTRGEGRGPRVRLVRLSEPWKMSSSGFSSLHLHGPLSDIIFTILKN